MKKLFTSDKFFLAMVLCAVIGEIAYAIIGIVINYSLHAQVVVLFRVACVICLYYSYKRHSKNVMKAMMGAMLAAQFITSILYLDFSTSYISVFAVCSILLFINHFIINSDHHSNPKHILVNQILVVVLFLNNTVQDILWFSAIASPLIIVWGIIDIIGFLGMTSIIVCVESRLDAYRLDREAAGWTEEKGYPEGYVHEYEKKDNK